MRRLTPAKDGMKKLKEVIRDLKAYIRELEARIDFLEKELNISHDSNNKELEKMKRLKEGSSEDSKEVWIQDFLKRMGRK